MKTLPSSIQQKSHLKPRSYVDKRRPMINTRRPDNLSGIFGILSGKVRLINQYIGVLNQDSILLHQNISLLNRDLR